MIGLAHLVWAPLGPEPLRDFLRSYHAHPAGAEHELAIVLNGVGPKGPADGSSREALLAELEGTEHRLIELERPTLDLAAYGQAAHRLTHEKLCFLNSYSVVLVDGWLERLADALEHPDVGLVGASASWESQAEWIRGRARHWPQQLARLPRARGDYPRFPNPHIRTTAFMLNRLALVEMALEQAADKRATYLLESGRRSITRRIQEQGSRVAVVGRDGQAYDVEGWPASRTFRSGDQENLLVADNQTQDYQTASSRRRRRLARDSWGVSGRLLDAPQSSEH
ncbi:MAG TPA: hypothetical protein VIJ66_11195 [Solirubrobacteraceae bacterium]